MNTTLIVGGIEGVSKEALKERKVLYALKPYYNNP
jgi:hypothetical protein